MEFVDQTPSSEPPPTHSTTTPTTTAVVKKPLVVRVKRKRTQESIDAICVEQHSSTHSSSSKKRLRGVAGLTAGLGLTSLTQSQVTKVLLTRIETIEEDGTKAGVSSDGASDGVSDSVSSSGKSLDSSTYNALKRSRVSDANTSSHTHTETDYDNDTLPAVKKKNRNDFKFIVTKNKKVFTSDTNASDSMIFVDMTSVESSSFRQEKEQPRNTCSVSNPSPKKGTRILDPLTRMLNSAINTALATGNFTDMLAAIDQGADVNFQRTDSDGYTCLMAAVEKSELKVVSKLLCKNANTLLQNAVTQTAVDIAEYAKLETKNHSASMILIMVRDKASEQYLQMQKSLGKGGDNDEEDDDDADYVYDIYTCHRPTAPTSDTDAKMDMNDDKIYDSVPNVKVSGLSLDDMGNAEIDFHYDSDWSDLAQDDDDVDSNDENYFGNDYPEEDEANSNDGYERNFDNMMSKSDDEDDIDSEDEGGRLPRFDRTGIGRQLKPFVVDEHQSSFGKTSEEIENLWSLEERTGEDSMMDPGGQQHANRLGDMEKRTGPLISTAMFFVYFSVLLQ